MANDVDHQPTEPLENGYASTTPPGDNLTIEFVRDLAESWRAYARHAGNATLTDEDLGLVLVDNGSPSLFLNPVVLLRPLVANDAVTFTNRTTEFFGAREGGAFAVWSLWPLPDLRPYGFMLAGHPPWMLREVGGTPTPTPSGLRVVEVDDAASAAAYEVALVNGFPVVELQPPQPGCFFAGDTLHTPGWRHFVGFVDDAPVATASVFVGDTLVRVDNVATVPEHRGRGYGAALTWAATTAAPDRPAVLLASDPGRSVYEAMGYRSLLRATLCVGMRPTSS